MSDTLSNTTPPLWLHLRYGRRNWHRLWLLWPRVQERIDWMRERRIMRRG